MAKTFQTNGAPVAARTIRRDIGDSKRQIVPYQSICDYAGREAQVSGFGDLIVGEKRPDISVVFNYFINSDFVNITATGTGAAVVDSSRLRISAVAGAGTVEAQSTRHIVYRMGHEAIAFFTCAFDVGAIGVTQRAGIFDDLDGYFISLRSDGQLQVNHLINGDLRTWNQIDDFNLDPLDGSGLSDFTINPQALLIYRIAYGYLGALPAIFEVYGGADKGWIPFHVVDNTNTDASLVLESPTLPIRFEATSDGTNDVTMFSGSWLGASIGTARDRALNDQHGFSVPASILAGVETVIGSMRVKTTFFGKANKVPVDFHNLAGGVDGVKPHTIRVYKNTGLTGPVWQDIISTESVVEIDFAGTLTGATGHELKFSTAIGREGSFDHEFETGELRLVAGETLTFTIESANTSDIVLAGQWDELK